MGLTILDEITLKNGKKVSGAYVSFSGKHLSIIPGKNGPFGASPDASPSKWIVTGSGYGIFDNKTDMNLLDTVPCDFEVTDADLVVPLHQMCYNYIKTKYNSTQDC